MIPPTPTTTGIDGGLCQLRPDDKTCNSCQSDYLQPILQRHPTQMLSQHANHRCIIGGQKGVSGFSLSGCSFTEKMVTNAADQQSCPSYDDCQLQFPCFHHFGNA